MTSTHASNEQVHQYSSLLAILFPPAESSSIITPIPVLDYSLYPQEYDLIKHTCDKRIHEFTAGRYCAHQAMQQIYISPQPVLIGQQREPVWPENITGSITHCNDLAGAVIASKDKINGLGFDIENIRQLKEDISRHLCTAEEKSWVINNSPYPFDLSVLLIFSIKESIYKCVYQSAGQKLTFHDCTIRFSKTQGDIHMVAETDIARNVQPENLLIKYQITPTHIFSGAVSRP